MRSQRCNFSFSPRKYLTQGERAKEWQRSNLRNKEGQRCSGNHLSPTDILQGKYLDLTWQHMPRSFEPSTSCIWLGRYFVASWICGGDWGRLGIPTPAYKWHHSIPWSLDLQYLRVLPPEISMIGLLTFLQSSLFIYTTLVNLIYLFQIVQRSFLNKQPTDYNQITKRYKDQLRFLYPVHTSARLE